MILVRLKSQGYLLNWRDAENLSELLPRLGLAVVSVRLQMWSKVPSSLSDLVVLLIQPTR